MSPECGTSLHDVVAEHAAAAPDRVAVEGSGASMTYGELHETATRLASVLRRHGIGRESIVAICATRSPERVAAVLGVLHAGGAFLPLDPAYPVTRLAFMLRQSGAVLLLGDDNSRPLLETLAAGHPGVLPVATFAQLNTQNAPARGRQAGPASPAEALAYIVFTSGSTGEPKGVALTHRGLANVIAGQRRVIGLRHTDRVLQFAPFSFDGATFELALAFGAGATVVLESDRALLPGDPLAATVDRLAITYLGAPPSTLAMTPADGRHSLTTLLTAGEVCPPHVVTRWRQPGRRFFNAYGPTETTIWATIELIDGDGAPPIGRPYSGVDVFVLDDELAVSGFAETGQIYIGGSQIARGYVGQPALTAERFVPSPFGVGERLYRTGDRATTLDDGRLVFTGRFDEQLKVRGHRIEPGEVEWRIAACPGVRDAVVTAVDVHATARLAAYYVAERDLPVDDLRARLATELPKWMVPATFTRIEAMPRTASGKVDRDALPAPESGAVSADERPPTDDDFVRRFCAVCADVLMIDVVDPEDDFFEIGGNSLLAAHLVARLQRQLGVCLPLLAVFEAATVRLMVAAVEPSA